MGFQQRKVATINTMIKTMGFPHKPNARRPRHSAGDLVARAVVVANVDEAVNDGTIRSVSKGEAPYPVCFSLSFITMGFNQFTQFRRS